MNGAPGVGAISIAGRGAGVGSAEAARETAVAPRVSGMGCGETAEIGIGAEISGRRRRLSCSKGEMAGTVAVLDKGNPPCPAMEPPAEDGPPECGMDEAPGLVEDGAPGLGVGIWLRASSMGRRRRRWTSLRRPSSKWKRCSWR